MYRVTLNRETGRHGVVRELPIVNSDDVMLVLMGFGHTQESIGSVRYTPGHDKVAVIEQYLNEMGL